LFSFIAKADIGTYSPTTSAAHTGGSVKTDLPSRHTLMIYGGPASLESLIEIVKFDQPKTVPYYSLTGGYNYRFAELWGLLGVESEFTVAKYLERTKLFSVNGAFVLRWLQVPWGAKYGGGFSWGNGLSWSNGVPEVEWNFLPRTNQLLWHIIIEFEKGLSEHVSTMFRIHHRSGIFGIFGNVTGGSDFLCLGLKYRI
jgi:hypothetical protein